MAMTNATIRATSRLAVHSHQRAHLLMQALELLMELRDFLQLRRRQNRPHLQCHVELILQHLLLRLCDLLGLRREVGRRQRAGRK
jgi:hypothetical protein